MVSEEIVRYLKQARRRYIVGTPKGVPERFEGELRAPDWHRVREGLEVMTGNLPSAFAHHMLADISMPSRMTSFFTLYSNWISTGVGTICLPRADRCVRTTHLNSTPLPWRPRDAVPPQAGRRRA
jgi:hypothetical protein